MQPKHIALGTAMLYVGDVEFALHTYTKLVPLLFGPILYSGGQLMIALSASYGNKAKAK